MYSTRGLQEVDALAEGACCLLVNELLFVHVFVLASHSRPVITFQLRRHLHPHHPHRLESRLRSARFLFFTVIIRFNIYVLRA